MYSQIQAKVIFSDSSPVIEAFESDSNNEVDVSAKQPKRQDKSSKPETRSSKAHSDSSARHAKKPRKIVRENRLTENLVTSTSRQTSAQSDEMFEQLLSDDSNDIEGGTRDAGCYDSFVFFLQLFIFTHKGV